MWVTISTQEYDLDGQVTLKTRDGSGQGTTTRRLSRTATLDGGVSVGDRGYSDGDRTLDLKAIDVSIDDYARLLHMQQTYPRVRVSTAEGLFLGALESLQPDGAGAAVKVMIVERLS